MKNMRKRMLSLMVVLMMSLSLVQPTAFAAVTGEETGTDGAGDINIQTVVVDNSAANTPDTTPSTTDTPPAPETSDGGNASDGQEAPGGDENPGDSGESEKPDLVNPDGSINPDAVDRPAQSDTVEVAPGAPSTEGTDSGEETTPPAEGDDTTPPVEEADPGEKVPPAGDESTKPESDNPWEVFYDEENDTYKLTFNIKENAEGNQVLDLTNALKLLNDYSNNLKENAGPSKPVYNDEILTDLFNTVPTANDYPQELLDIAASIGKNANWLKTELMYHCIYGDPLNSKFKEALDKWNTEAIASKVDLPNDLQPGDILKFEFYLTSDSKHVYKYKDGSFILATANLNNGSGTDGDSFDGIGFDGQQLTPEYLAKPNTFTFSGHFEPLLNLFLESGVPESEIKAAHNSIEDMLYYVKTYDRFGGEEAYQKILSGLGCTSEADINAGTITQYVLDYYNEKDGTNYTDLTKLFEMNSEALAELSSTSTNRPWTFGGDELSVSLGSDYLYDNFYKSLLSFVYGDRETIDDVTGNKETDGYENDSWTDDGREAALYYYMAHQEIWEETNQYFTELLEKGLTASQATWTSFMMALNIDGELTGNDWQNTEWPWYNSIELEQMDIDFSLTKKDGETGETITNSETGFQVYYIDKVKGEDGNETSVNMYCTYDEETQSYTFKATPSTVWTENGELKIDYAMMKDIVYYLQETVAPDGYEKDPNVYIVMNEDDYNQLTEADKAGLEGTFDKFLDMTVTNGGLSVSTNFVNVKIVTTPDRPTPTPTPDPDPDPEEPPVDVPDPDVPLVPGPEPEEPPVDIPDDNPPLVDIPEEEPPLVEVPDPDVPLAPRPSTPNQPVPGVDIPDEDVPLADVPNTGDVTGLWCALGLVACAGLAYFFLDEKKRQNNAK